MALRSFPVGQAAKTAFSIVKSLFNPGGGLGPMWPILSGGFLLKDVLSSLFPVVEEYHPMFNDPRILFKWFQDTANRAWQPNTTVTRTPAASPMAYTAPPMVGPYPGMNMQEIINILMDKYPGLTRNVLASQGREPIWVEPKSVSPGNVGPSPFGANPPGWIPAAITPKSKLKKRYNVGPSPMANI